MTDFIVGCRGYYLNNRFSPMAARHGFFYERLKSGLSNTLLALCISYEGWYLGWEADLDHPGYMIRMDSPNAIRAPIHLVPVFPSSDTLHEVGRISGILRVSEHSVMCVSGSNALGRALTQISDIDFCEYVFTAPEKLGDVIGLSGPLPTSAVCMGFKVGDKVFAAPWSNKAANLDEANFIIESRNGAPITCKLDFIGHSAFIGVTELSNLAIVCDGDSEETNFEMTFAAQEAVVGMNNWVPNQFGEPIEIGRYVDWLLKQVSHHCRQGNITKALKRALSLSRICFLAESTDDIVGIFEESVAPQEEELSAMEALQVKCAASAMPAAEFATDLLQNQIAARRAQLDIFVGLGRSNDVARYRRRGLDACQRILGRIDERASAEIRS